MKSKLILHILLILTSHHLYSQSETSNGQIKNIAIQSNIINEQNLEYKFSRKPFNSSFKKLNNNFLLNERIAQTWMYQSTWKDSSKSDYFYNEDNNLIEFLYQFRTDTQWINFYKTQYTYYNNTYLAESTILSWTGTEWRESQKVLYTYATNNQLIEILIRRYYPNGTGWKNFRKISHTYDANGNLIQVMTYEWYDYWREGNKELYTYYNNNKVNYIITMYYDGFTWRNNYKYSYSYDAEYKLIEITWQYWGGSTWSNFYKYSYTYDLNANLIQSLKMVWDDGSFWRNYTRDVYTFDEYNNEIEDLSQNPDGLSWKNASRRLFTYTLVTDIKDDMSVTNSFNLSNSYPNPFNPSTKINYTIPQQSFVTIKVYDLLGREVATLVNGEKPAGSFEIEFNANSLTSGVYLYQLRANGFVETKKMILMK